MTAHAAIFDLDGVLVDTAAHHFAAWRSIAAELGFALADEHEELLKGVGRADALRVVLGIGGLDIDEVEAARLADLKNAQYVESIEELTPSDLLPGAEALLRSLRGHGIPIALASASRNAPRVLERLGIADLFDAVVDGNTVTQSKPDPAVFDAAAELLGVAAADCVVFEDALAGIAGARAAGMVVVGIGDPDALQGADTVLGGLAEAGQLEERGVTFTSPVAGASRADSVKIDSAGHGSVRLGDAPFHLDAAAQGWVHDTLAAMDEDAKLGQLFCLLAEPATLEQADADFEVAEPGGYMRRPSMSSEVVQFNALVQGRARVPLLIAANLEAGANGVAFDATSMGSPLQAAATDDAEHARRMGEVCAVQGRALGVNWAFSPIVDIQTNWRNPIVLNRGFGDSTERVARMGTAFVEGLQSNGVAASVKHWPGDGVDDRDQHVVTTVNTMSVPDWDASFGTVYKAMIEAGALTLMAAHIALPAYSRVLRPGIADEDILPASLAPEITTDLLRGNLGFNGLVVTDATLMGGMQMSMPRAQAVPQSIAAGCDMFLFTQDYAQDLAHMRAGLHAGVVTADRLDQAVTRVLALKAALGLHAMDIAELVPDSLDQIDRGTHERWAMEQAGAAITLVKDLEAGLLPLRPEERPRILVYSLRGGALPTTTPAELLCKELGERGFTATLHDDPPREATMFQPVGTAGAVTGTELVEGFDAVIYVADVPPTSNAATARLEWTFWTAANLPRYTHEVPTLVVSVANPFHLQDVPRVKTYVNAYAGNPATIRAVVERLVGDAPFIGRSPVDPFCGYWDAGL